jgi:hypothetical protein
MKNVEPPYHSRQKQKYQCLTIRKESNCNDQSSLQQLKSKLKSFATSNKKGK